jgi:hypothetical protein
MEEQPQTRHNNYPSTMHCLNCATIGCLLKRKFLRRFLVNLLGCNQWTPQGYVNVRVPIAVFKVIQPILNGTASIFESS